MNRILSASVLNADFSKLGDQVKIVESVGVDHLHLDVMDGHFVPNLSFGYPVIKSLRFCTSLFFDVHLMVTNPWDYFEELKRIRVDGVTVHIETLKNPLETIQKMRNFGFRVGITLKPQTPIEILKPILSKVDLILVMTVEPGFGGQSLILNQLDKIKWIRKELTEKPMDIQVDGGWNENNVHLALEAGANDIVFGSSIFEKENIAEAVKTIRCSLEK